MKKGKKRSLSVSGAMMMIVAGIVLVAVVAGLLIFIMVYRRSMLDNAMITSEQATTQASNIVENYMEDLFDALSVVEEEYGKPKEQKEEKLNALVSTRSDVVAITSYALDTREMNGYWTGRYQKKETVLQNLSLPEEEPAEGQTLVSSPHVESLLVNYYPWVVSVSRVMKDKNGVRNLVVMDLRFSHIANYVDDVGIGSHGYCFIMDGEGTIVYHPQQQLIFAGLKEENTEGIADREDGSYRENGIIYTIKSKENSDWRIVGVNFMDEMVTDRVISVVSILCALLLAVLAVVIASGLVLSRMISRPIQGLVDAMREFERNAADFSYQPVRGSSEIEALSDSFGHMVVRIQELMTQVRNEEISLRKTELRALQAQINPHFLYNTLDSIGWMCEEGNNQGAVEMVNALARLFRISISKGHELITIAKELEHAKSYLQIQNYRYKNQFSYSFDVDESCLGYYCNKITLQPIIENAIYHGLNRMVDEGEIRISVHEIENVVIFTMEDNGVGMTPEQCRNILHKEPGDKTGIGIKNVNDRIQIYFGEPYGLTIESEQDVGTKVTITMPKLLEENHE